ncbi:MAG: S8 family serine peptidase [Bacteroidota bacterium]
MRKSLLIIVSLFIFLSLNAQDFKTIKINGSDCVNGHIIVKFKKDYSDAGGQNISALRQNLISKYRTTVKKQWRMKAELWQIDTLQMPRATQTILDSLKKLPYVQYAEPDFIVKADVIPNDPSFNQLWGMHNTGQNGGTPGADIKAPEAWDITTGDTNIIVGVIDSGIDYLHPDLAANIWTNWDEIPGNGIDDDNNGYIDDVHGWDFYNNDNDPMDDNSHGTHVAGTIGAVGNNGIGVVGVAWKVRLMALKFLNAGGSGETSAAISALEYATANGAKLTNNSWGGGEFSQALYDAISSADSAGKLFVVAAGNNSSDNDISVSYPSCYSLENIISVASTDRTDHLSGFSNWGVNTVDIAAPGSGILSSLPSSNYGYLSGTSMATPYITGAAVLAWSRYPTQSNLQVKQHLLGSGDQNDQLLSTINSGSRLNLFTAINDSVIPSLILSSRYYDFGAEIIHHYSPPRVFLLTNAGNSQTLIDSIVCQKGFIITSDSIYSNKLNAFMLPPNHIDTFHLEFVPDSANSYLQKLIVYYSLNSNHRLIPVTLKGVAYNSGTIVQAGSVAGIWNSSESPYYINGDILIGPGQSLVIHPGVKILFAGHYSLSVQNNGRLSATGTAENKIFWQPTDSLGGWNGITFRNSGEDDSLFYCVLKYSKRTSPNYYWWQLQNRYLYTTGGAILCDHSSPKIVNCFISNNLVHGPPGGGDSGGGISVFYSNALLQGNIITNNSADKLNDGWGGAVYIGDSCNATVLNNTIANNYAYYAGGGIGILRSTFDIQNNIISGNLTFSNGANQVFASSPYSYFTFKNCLVNGSYNINGENVFSKEPGFFAPTGGTGITFSGQINDWGLKDSSVCINTFPHPANIFSPLIDIDGNPRIYNGTIDLGASENHSVHSTVSSEPFSVLNFSFVIVNDTATIGLIIFNTSSTLLHLDSIEIQSGKAFFSKLNNPANLNILPGDSLIQTIRFIPGFIGLHSGTLIIHSSAYNFPQKEIMLKGTGISTHFLTGNIHGRLLKQNSPYSVIGDIQISPYDTLIIDPGTTILFMDHFSFTVGPNTVLLSKGLSSDSIIFQACDTIGGWNGLRFQNSDNNDTITFTRFSFGRKWNGNTLIETSGGAVYTYNSSPFIKHCTFNSNSTQVFATEDGGGAIFLQNSSNVHIEDCLFRHNRSAGSGGALCSFYSSFIFKNNEVRYCLSDKRGGALCSDYGFSDRTLIDHNLFYRNIGFQSVVCLSSNLASGNILSNNYFANNDGNLASALFIIGSEYRLFNNILANNNSGIYIQNCDPQIFNNVISNNYNCTSGGIYIQGNNGGTANPLICNNVLRGNNGSQIGTNGSVNPSIQHNLIQNGFPGVANFDANPWFINPTPGYNQQFDALNSDWHLQGNSPCINKGRFDTIGMNIPETDKDWHVRIFGDTIDLGAYEFGSPLWHPGIKGYFAYNNIAVTPLDSMTVYLATVGNGIDTTMTNITGHYKFLQIASGTYNILGSYSKLWGGINGTDALKIQRHFAGIELLTEPVRLQAADVNASGSINGTDALKIKRRFAGLDTTFAAGNWVFAKPTVGGNTVVVQDENVVQNFYGLCVGDVNGSYVPGSGAKSSAVVCLAYKPSIDVHAGQEFHLPVTVDQASDVSAVSLVLKFPEEKIRIQDVRMQDGREVVFRQFADEVRMAWSEVTRLELKPGDTLLTLYCKVADELVKDELIYPEITSETELADQSANPISGSTLNIYPIQLKTGKLPDNAPNSENGGLQLIPNPNTGRFSIQIDPSFNGIGKIDIYDSKGISLIQSQSVKISNGVSSEINFSNQARGLYMVKLKYNKTELQEKMLIR